jgi:hypothetical protein
MSHAFGIPCCLRVLDIPALKRWAILSHAFGIFM